MIVIRHEAAHPARGQQLVQSLARKPGEHEAVFQARGRACEDGGHGHHRDGEEHEDHLLPLVFVQDITQEVREVGHPPLKCRVTYPDLEAGKNESVTNHW